MCSLYPNMSDFQLLEAKALDDINDFDKELRRKNTPGVFRYIIEKCCKFNPKKRITLEEVIIELQNNYRNILWNERGRLLENGSSIKWDIRKASLLAKGKLSKAELGKHGFKKRLQKNEMHHSYDKKSYLHPGYDPGDVLRKTTITIKNHSKHILDQHSLVWGARKIAGPVATGAVGVFVYHIRDQNQSLVFMWSIPFDYNFYSNWWAIQVYDSFIEANYDNNSEFFFVSKFSYYNIYFTLLI
ncbi:326_t:CDS:2 [Dentiscutata erythropus]|uniref:326_t:CDS:1 n=1 Tax=Dentiscutata erythropus TaxID=1348616 RepID=A0A9N9E1K6_9GLOM|nr:326_t:CDS:2 [Dentiscutata erythropus]